jgi:hypothetical protein
LAFVGVGQDRPVTDERQENDELTDEELDRQDATPLPDREVMSTMRPPIVMEPIDGVGIDPMPQPEVE